MKRVLVDGWPVATVAEQLGISRATGYKWVRRYRAEGLAGIEDAARGPIARQSSSMKASRTA